MPETCTTSQANATKVRSSRVRSYQSLYPGSLAVSFAYAWNHVKQLLSQLVAPQRDCIGRRLLVIYFQRSSLLQSPCTWDRQ
jgi:hypothetical protein